jgi:spermidine/putrescine transport system substrate-binding protein
MVIPVGAAHKANAQRLMDWYYQPEIAADLANWVGYICPVPAAKDVLLGYGDDSSIASANSPLVFPTESDLSNVSSSRELTEDEERRYETDWNAVVT